MHVFGRYSRTYTFNEVAADGVVSAQNGSSVTSTEYRIECRQDSSTRCRKDNRDRNA